MLRWCGGYIVVLIPRLFGGMMMSLSVDLTGTQHYPTKRITNSSSSIMFCFQEGGAPPSAFHQEPADIRRLPPVNVDYIISSLLNLFSSDNFTTNLRQNSRVWSGVCDIQGLLLPTHEHPRVIPAKPWAFMGDTSVTHERLWRPMGGNVCCNGRPMGFHGNR